MSLAGTAETHADKHFPGVASENSRPSAKHRGSPSAAAGPGNRNASSGSVGCSQSPCSFRSLSSYDDYSEDFLSECSETAVHRNDSEKPEVKEKKGEKKNCISKVSQPKGKKLNVATETKGVVIMTLLFNALILEAAHTVLLFFHIVNVHSK